MKAYGEGESRPGWRRCPACAASRPYFLKRSQPKDCGFGRWYTIACSACGHRWDTDCFGATKLQTAPYDKRIRT